MRTIAWRTYWKTSAAAGHVALGDARVLAEAFPDGRADRPDRHLRRQGGEPAEEGGVGQRPPDLALCHLGCGHGHQAVAAGPHAQRLQTEFVEGPRGIDQDRALRAQPGEEVDLVHERGVDDDDAVRFHDGLPGPDLPLVQAAVGHHRCAHALRAEAGERLREPTLLERRQGQEVRRGDDALTTPTVEAHLEHDSQVATAADGGVGTKVPPGGRDHWHYASGRPDETIEDEGRRSLEAGGAAMSVRVAINGFGRTGRSLLRAAMKSPHDIEVAAVNDLGDPEALARLLARDSVHGHFPEPVTLEHDKMMVGPMAVTMLMEPNPRARCRGASSVSTWSLSAPAGSPVVTRPPPTSRLGQGG